MTQETTDRPLTIREATEADLPALEWDGEYTHFRRVYRLTLREVRTGHRVMLVAEVGGEIVGQVFIQLCGTDPRFADGCRRGYLYSFRVRSAYRGQGIGSRLLAAAEAHLRDLGYREAIIAAARSNRAARRLYERSGYRVFMEDPGQWSYIDHLGQCHQVREPCWVFEKRL